MATKREIIKIDETTEMLFKDDAAKKNWGKIFKKLSQDPYGKCVVDYARRWAKYMQVLIAEGKTVDEIAKEASTDCDFEAISGFMYGCAVTALVRCWKYGSELKKWHNNYYGYEGDGVAIPAVLTIEG